MSGGMTVPDFKLYYRAISNRTAWYWDKTRHADWWTQTEDPNVSSCTYRYLIFDKETKKSLWRKNGISTNGAGQTEGSLKNANKSLFITLHKT